NISVIEVDYHNRWQLSRLAIITGGEATKVDKTLNYVINFIKEDRKFQILNYDFERR
ncbi:MAG TPA: DUF503 family protein, partial [bacterium (Candidatus Stahlbacteria)]|nr:DUF503 family protein [Candidatus Stahlbacteria bacterium]